ncbi:CehA/McbA family metallohydrolase [Clostridium aestuarii]|uniref:CehA/McbA family metallohydrolase n=1 Tax=Clostridium aestuarii TaxID=338193 RepID=A0ABT4D2D1_9CLOT|nr:CehA/McbA family metallohydrolase [Clostridium aestuarii]MCY6484330.1 CehA/McbA family metallohydrolase [Clostridium aestuarii]
MYKDIIIVNPKNKSSTYDCSPEISLILLPHKSINNIINAKMYLDNKKVNCKIAQNKISYTPFQKLHSGNHHIKISILDSYGNTTKMKWSFKIKKNRLAYEKYNFYYGIPHAHTSYSTGRGTPLEAFKYAYKRGLDFLIITDHSKSLGKKITYNSKQRSKWHATEEQTIKFIKKGKHFLSLRGFEVSSNHYGDFNVINSANFVKSKVKDFDKFNHWLEDEKSAIVSINHPHKYIESFKFHKGLDKFINFIEVGNGSPPYKYLNGEKYYYKLLDKGWHLGAINGQDNHRANWGDTDNLTVVVSKSLREQDFMEAFKNRRTYSSETRTLKLSILVNNCHMGSIIKTNSTRELKFNIIAEDKKNPINKIEIISNGGEIIKEKIFNTQTKAAWNTSLPYISEKWYVIKIIHKNNKCGIASAVFTE